jgi:hypothetical protein
VVSKSIHPSIPRLQSHINRDSNLLIYVRLYSLCGPWSLFRLLNVYTVGRTPWTGDQPVARPLLTHRTAHTAEIHASSGIRTHDPSVRAGEDGSCLIRPAALIDVA